jgi:hypothetical protein
MAAEGATAHRRAELIRVLAGESCVKTRVLHHLPDVPGITLEERADSLKHDQILPVLNIVCSEATVVELEQIQIGFK